jgi:hypothetical protein
MSDVNTVSPELLDEGFGDIAPSIREFDGDIVAVSVQEPKPEWGADAKKSLKLIVRDWNATEAAAEEGKEEAVVRYPKRIAMTTSARAHLSALRGQAKKLLGVDLVTARSFFDPATGEGLVARFRIEDKNLGDKYEQKDFITIIGKASRPKPTNLLPYVPKFKTDGDEESAPANSAPVSLEVSEEALEALREVIGDERDPGKVRKLATASKAFKGQFGTAYAALIANTEGVLANI